jgi:cytochrome P450
MILLLTDNILLRILDREISKLVRASIADPETSSRSIVKLSLKDREVTQAAVEQASDQLRTFIFAGFDTTSTTIQWMCYYLSLPHNSGILDKLIEEHDRILGPVTDQGHIESVLLTDPLMPYTTAVIKETLRLEPPASTARYIPADSSSPPFEITTSDGHSYVINGTVIYIIHKIIQSSTKVWGPDSKVFRPERWLDKEYMANLPAGAFRPFERGPRACIGQELAMMEAKVVLALIARKFVFKKYTPKEEHCELGEVWNSYNITAGPFDGMRMTVKKR